MPMIAFVKKFRREFEDHLEGRPCPYEKQGVVEEVRHSAGSRRLEVRVEARRICHGDGCEGETPSRRPAGRRSLNRSIFMADVTLTVDGKKVTAPAGTLLIEACKTRGHRSAFVLLLPQPFVAGRLPHVPGED